MKRSQIKNIIIELIKEEKGYSKYHDGPTSGLTTDTLNKILLRIAKEGEDTTEEEIDEKYEGDPENGNRVLDRASQEDIDKLLNDEESLWSEKCRMQELAGLKKEIRINKPGLKNLKDELCDVVLSYQEDEGGDEEDYSFVKRSIKDADNKDELLKIMTKFLHDEDLAKEYIG